MAQVFDVEMDAGDVIVMGSDGLFDNVWDDDIVAVVYETLEEVGPKLRSPV